MINTLALLLQTDTAEPVSNAAAAGMGIGAVIFMLLYFGVIILMLAGMWKIFAKAGEPGWAAIVPIYSAIVLCKVAGKPAWWFIILGLVVPWILVAIALAKNFGKETGFGLGIAFLPFIFLPMLGFSDAQYRPVAQ